jgi:hypothetical protein
VREGIGASVKPVGIRLPTVARFSANGRTCPDGVLLAFHYRVFCMLISHWVMAWLGQLVAGLSPQSPVQSHTIYVGIMVNKVAVGGVFL